MKQLGLKFFTDTHLTIAALLIFFVLFVVMVIYQLRSHQKEHVKVLEKLPFEGEEYEFRQS